MNKPTHQGSRNGKDTTPGPGQRSNPSWIDRFTEWSAGIESPEIYRRWAAITVLGAVLEQRVFLVTHRQLYPNLYTMLVGPPGVGKSITIGAIAGFVRGLDGLHIGPVSVTGASLIDAMAKAKRHIIDYSSPEPTLEYNSLLLIPDDLQALLHEYSSELVANLTIFYNTAPYVQTRRTGNLEISINSPQLSMLGGTTPSQLLNVLPNGAWDEGFMSRTIMVFAADHPTSDDIFASSELVGDPGLESDLQAIFTLRGQMAMTDEFRQAFNDWRKNDKTAPTHPRLTHYCTRRVGHLLKLCMIASVDRSDDLRIEHADLSRALGWLHEAELTMPGVFGEMLSSDAKVMQEICYAMGTKEIQERKFTRMVAERVSAHAVRKVVELMQVAGMVTCTRVDNFGNRYFRISRE